MKSLLQGPHAASELMAGRILLPRLHLKNQFFVIAQESKSCFSLFLSFPFFPINSVHANNVHHYFYSSPFDRDRQRKKELGFGKREKMKINLKINVKLDSPSFPSKFLIFATKRNEKGISYSKV